MTIIPFEQESPKSDVVTDYDERHLTTYIRLLDADAQGADWREVVSIVFGLDPEQEPVRSRQVHESHLKRARWMTETGYKHLLAK
ncbi:MAG: DNA -binding domain-containing protein [Parasphingorhabdus sp.]